MCPRARFTKQNLFEPQPQLFTSAHPIAAALLTFGIHSLCLSDPWTQFRQVLVQAASNNWCAPTIAVLLPCSQGADDTIKARRWCVVKEVGGTLYTQLMRNNHED